MHDKVPQDPGQTDPSRASTPLPEPGRGLEEVLRRMRWRREPGRFGLLGFPEPPGAAALALLVGSGPAQVIREGEETTVLAPLDALEPVRAAHPQAECEQPLVWVRFELPMAWDLVGFLAHVTAALAEAEVPVGAVCGYSRDHLFLAADAWPRARRALEERFGPPSEAPPN